MHGAMAVAVNGGSSLESPSTRGGGMGGGARSGIGPKFATYAIFGNVVMLCQGSDAVTSLERCSLMAEALVLGE